MTKSRGILADRLVKIPRDTPAPPEFAALASRCDEFGDCLIWRDSTTEQGYPIYKPVGCGCTLVRRAVFVMHGGQIKTRQPVVTTCGERACINPQHLAASTTRAVALAAGARGAHSGIAIGAKIAAVKRASVAKITMEAAREIRLSTETGPVLAQRHGVHKSLNNSIKRGKAWKDYSNPFAGLMR